MASALRMYSAIGFERDRDLAPAIESLGLRVLDQRAVDAMLHPSDRQRPAPAGSQLTLDRVAALLEELDDTASATEIGERLGMSRVSARRYLEHFVTTGRAEVRLRYGTAGRPERRYRRAGV